jgi:hypothetical protein
LKNKRWEISKVNPVANTLAIFLEQQALSLAQANAEFCQPGGE